MNYKGVKDQIFRCESCNAEIQWKGHTFNHKFCNNKCQGNYRSNNRLLRDRPLFFKGELKRRSAIKPFLYELQGNKCSICLQEPMHNGKLLTMILDHIDGNATNNNPSNLRLVCPNCDSQLPTFKSRNKGNGRASHGLKWNSSQ
jgi:hypothetical protein